MAAGAARWIDDLPGTVAALERDWAITARRALSGGTGLLCTQIGLQPQGRLLLAAAEALAG
jgi:hypothetical protein